MKSMTVDELKDKIDNGHDFKLIDARTEQEYEEGHIRDAFLMPYDEIGDMHDILYADKDEDIIVYCRTDNRSRVATSTLIGLGYTNVSFVLGGMIEWEQKGYPVQR
ncbi:MAG: rhodanese-like domain-containing protein [Nanoarchaeota archaeon]